MLMSAAPLPSFVTLISEDILAAAQPPPPRMAQTNGAVASSTAGLWSVIRGKSAPSLLQLIKDGADIHVVGGVRTQPAHAS